jgi:hypothetical protein
VIPLSDLLVLLRLALEEGRGILLSPGEADVIRRTLQRAKMTPADIGWLF